MLRATVSARFIKIEYFRISDLALYGGPYLRLGADRCYAFFSGRMGKYHTAELKKLIVEKSLTILKTYYHIDACTDGRIKLLSNLVTVRILLLAASFEFFPIFFFENMFDI